MYIFSLYSPVVAKQSSPRNVIEVFSNDGTKVKIWTFLLVYIFILILLCVYSPSDQLFRTESPAATVNLDDTDGHKISTLVEAHETEKSESALQVLSESGNPVGLDLYAQIHNACKHGRLDIIVKLASQCEFDLQHSLSLLQLAVEEGHVSIVVFFLDKGAKPFLKSGVTNPLHIAAIKGNTEIVKVLVQSSTLRSFFGDNEGNTPLHHAAIHGHFSLVVYLSNVANHPVSQKNKKGETPLHLAAKHGHCVLLRFFIDEKGCDPTACCGRLGCTPLHLACKCGSLDIVKYLSTEKSCNLECKTYSPSKRKKVGVITGRTPLHYASYGGHLDIVSYMVADQSCNPLCTDDRGFTPLHLACQEGHFEMVQFFVQHTHSHLCGLTTVDGKSPLHLAALSGNVEIVKLLSSLDDSPQLRLDNDGRTVLHYACRNGCTDIAQFLVNVKGFNPSQPDQTGMTPLHQAAQHGKTDVVKWLVSTIHCNPTPLDENGYTPLHLAANRGKLDIVQFLVEEKYCSVIVRDKNARTPLHHACQSGHQDVVMFLASYPECDPNCQDKSLKATPLHLAASFGHTRIVRYLIEDCACSPICTDKFNSTLVHRASASGQLKVIQYLVKEKQCNILVKNKFGNTPLHLACQKGQVEMIKFLLSLSTENITWRNQVGRMPLDLAGSTEILSLFLKLGVDPSKGSIAIRYPYLKHWNFVHPMVRIFLLGDPLSGKSTLVKTLQASGFLTEWMVGRFHPRIASTDGRSTGVHPTMIDSRHFGKVVLYDFSGNCNSYAGHSAVLNFAMQHSTSLFLIFVDLRKTSAEIEQSVVYWCAFVNSSFTDKETRPQVIIVGSHEDELTKEDFKHKPAILERITSSTIFGVELCRWVTVNCHKAASLSKLRQFISIRCDSIRSLYKPNHETSLARSFIQHKFQSTIVIEVRELLEFISHSDIPDIKSRDCLIHAVKDLHSRGYILLLSDKQFVENSWIIHNQEAILSTVHSVQKQVSLTNNLGMVPISELEKLLGLMGFNLALIVRYFILMRFCIRISDRKVFHSVVGFHPPHPLDDYLFFPHLVQQEAPRDLWKYGPTWVHKFGFCMQCVIPQQFLGPRYQQVLFLRLLTTFPFNTDPNSPYVSRKVSCSIWKHGVSWVDSRGIEVVVEIVQNMRAVLFMMQVQKGSFSNTDFALYRSHTISLIRSVYQEICPRVVCSEYLLHPAVLSSTYPIKHHGNEDTISLPAFSFPYVAKSLAYPRSKHFEADCLLFGSDTTPSADLVSVSLQDLCIFESYLSLSVPLLNILFCKQQCEVNISEEFLNSLAENLSDTKFGVDNLARMLHVQVNSMHSQNTVDQYRQLLLRWKCRNISQTFNSLRCAFDHYSIFLGTTLLCELA